MSSNIIEDYLSVVRNALECVSSCETNLASNNQYAKMAVTRIESVIASLEVVRIRDNHRLDRQSHIIRTLETAVLSLVAVVDNSIIPGRRGRPRLIVQVSSLEYLLSMNFKIPHIASMLAVSPRTIKGRLKENGLSVRQTYTTISDDELDTQLLNTLMTHPNTGYKRMKGYLLVRGIKVTDQRVRERMRIVDPSGVYQRTRENRAIDTNLKLIRWKIVVRGAVDGKSRTGLYLEAGPDNTAGSGILSFLKGVAEYGVPLRTRSDKGGENVLIARYMLEARGLARGSHICGRSVHNQRIERFWRDVSYGCISFYHCLFRTLEEDGVLNIDRPSDLFVLHKVFLPRLNRHLNMFRTAWNHHPISTEQNFTPTQLLLMHLPPVDTDLNLTEIDLEDLQFVCNQLDDTALFDGTNEDTITYPIPPTEADVPDDVVSRINLIDHCRDSNNFGYDIFLEAMGSMVNN